jgi:ABC-2 type transport system ATP-binding protein
MSWILQTQGLSKIYRRSDGSQLHAVKDVNLQLRAGEIFSLLGPNGAGKTTLIGLISGLLPPTAGDALIGGHSITREPIAAKQLFGYIPQEIALYPELSARQNLRFFGQMYGLGGKALEARVDEILALIDLSDRQHDRVETFSGGMKRRVNIGVGLLHHPRLLYMDEPTVGIDPQSRRRILDMAKQLRNEQGVTILYTTHLMEEAQELSDRVAILDHGEIIAQGTQSELTHLVGEQDHIRLQIGGEQPATDLVAQLRTQIPGINEVSYLEPSPEQSEERIPPGTLVVTAQRGRSVLPGVIHQLSEAGVEIQSVQVHEPDLEAVFLALTGRALRD